MRRLACLAFFGLGCTSSNPAYHVDDGVGSAEETGGAEASTAQADAGTDGVGSATGEDGPSLTSDAPATGSSGGEPDCPEACGEDASCVLDGSGPTCACDPGFEGDGFTCVPVPSLAPLAWQLDCMGSSPSCTGDYVCAVEVPLDEHPVTRSDSAVLQADPALLYDVKLHVRAVVEPKAYDGGDTNSHWNEGGTPVLDEWNVAYLQVDDPPRLIYVNAGPPSSFYCLAIDQELVVRMRGGATLEIGTMDPNDCAVINIDAPGGRPIAIPEVDAPTQPHDGQFMLVEAVDIAAQ